jgi:hypothetical protein
VKRPTQAAFLALASGHLGNTTLPDPTLHVQAALGGRERQILRSTEQAITTTNFGMDSPECWHMFEALNGLLEVCGTCRESLKRHSEDMREYSPVVAVL